MNALVYSTSLAAAFIGGVLALFAPCCIVTLLPNFVGAAVYRGMRLLPVTAALFSAGLAVVLLPIVLGVGALGHVISSYHRPLFVLIGGGLVLLGLYIVRGRSWLLPLPMPRWRTGRGGGSVFVLGMASGVASSCCAPVVAGVIAMSALSSSVAGAFGLGLAYVFGMVLPLLFFALAAGARHQATAAVRPGRRVSLLGKTMPWTDAVSGLTFMVVGVLTLGLGVSGQESWTPGPLADWDSWLTARMADLVALLDRAPIPVQILVLAGLALVVAMPLVRAIRRATRVVPGTPPKTPSASPAVDPICGMSVVPGREAASVVSHGVTLFFCSTACAEAFARTAASAGAVVIIQATASAQGTG